MLYEVITAVVRNIDRHVADHLDVARVAMLFELCPLSERQELNELAEVQCFCKPIAPVEQSLRLAPCNVRLPIGPGTLVVRALDGPKQGVVLEPEGILLAEVVILVAQNGKFSVASYNFV